MNRLKNHESPRKLGKRKKRNDKGKGGTARSRQLKKKFKCLKKRLKENKKGDNK
ncbi:hypothetical protein V6O07_00455 [Arthrospira platensis SPKY2]